MTARTNPHTHGGELCLDHARRAVRALSTQLRRAGYAYADLQRVLAEEADRVGHDPRGEKWWPGWCALCRALAREAVAAYRPLNASLGAGETRQVSGLEERRL